VVGNGLAGRLAAARADALVGRQPERAVLERMLLGSADAPVVAYLHGAGGIGKSSLLRHTAQKAQLAGRPAVQLDGRYLDVDPRLFEEAATSVSLQPGAVLLVDSFEQCQTLEAWLRDSFLPRLAEDALVVLASRVAPDPEWSLDPGWAPLFAELPVRPLALADAHALLAARGVAAQQRDALVAFAGGSPLALSLGASVITARPDVDARWEASGDVLTTLVQRLLGDVPGPTHQRALEVLAQARVTRESLLRAVLGDEVTAGVFPWLRQLPYVEVTSEGLHPHDAVRATLDADLHWRDPERHDDVRLRVSRATVQAVRNAGEDEALACVTDWLFLFRDLQGVSVLKDWRGYPHVEDTPLVPADAPEVVRMAQEAGGPASARAAAHWLRRQPQAFRIYRYAGTTAPVAFMTTLRLEAPLLPEDRAADPVVDAIWAHVEANGVLERGEHVNVRRFATQPDLDEQFSPVLDLMGRRTVAGELRAIGRAATFIVFEDTKSSTDHLAGWGLLEVCAVEVGDRVQYVFGRNVRQHGEEHWIEQATRAARAPSTGQPDSPSVTGELSRHAFEAGVLEALRTWHTPREFATNALLGSRLVPPGSQDPVTDLRAAITRALAALQVDSPSVKAHEALTATYITAARTQKAAARRLGVPYGTYRRHLALAKERLIGQLLRQLNSVVPAPPALPASGASSGG